MKKALLLIVCFKTPCFARGRKRKLRHFGVSFVSPVWVKQSYLLCRWSFTSILIFFLSFQDITHSQILTDIKINSSPNPVGSGARATGMGGAFIAVADDATMI